MFSGMISASQRNTRHEISVSAGCTSSWRCTLNTSDFTTKDITRFWSKVAKSDDPDACWEWTATKSKRGYGRIRINGKLIATHRIAYELANDCISSDLYVCHHCDNPSCCNPNHLFLGTHTDNMHDMYSKQRRTQRGESNGNSKLNWNEVRYIRKKYAEGGTIYRTLAEQFKVSISAIKDIISHRNWNE